MRPTFISGFLKNWLKMERHAIFEKDFVYENHPQQQKATLMNRIKIKLKFQTNLQTFLKATKLNISTESSSANISAGLSANVVFFCSIQNFCTEQILIGNLLIYLNNFSCIVICMFFVHVNIFTTN